VISGQGDKQRGRWGLFLADWLGHVDMCEYIFVSFAICLFTPNGSPAGISAIYI
jgi:hypothetical protein